MRPTWDPGRTRPAEPGATSGRRGRAEAVRTADVGRSVSEKEACSIGCVVEELYDMFNRCDANGTAACFVEDVVYEDLLLGSSTIVESREDFRKLIQSHPVFLGYRACKAAGLPPPDVRVVVDGISEDLARRTVGVEWHVEVNGDPLGLGRGISFFRICPTTGLIKRAVDIAEAPWRVIGLLVAPILQAFKVADRVLSQLLVPPVVVFGAALLPVVVLCIVFLDKPTMDGLRADIDWLADYRETLPEAPTASTAELVGRAMSQFPGANPWDRQLPP